MKNKQFFHLNSMPAVELKDGFGLDSLVLDKEMIFHNGGIDISNLGVNKIKSIDCTYPKSFFPCFDNFNDEYKKKEISKIIRKYKKIDEPCSMIINSNEELSEYMSIGYQISHFNYILGKKCVSRQNFPRLKYDFPKFFCGPSSRNLMLSLISFGFPNAAYALSQEHDHAYIILPFVLKKEKAKGAILVDPTYEQLWNNTREKIGLFIRLGSEWEYRTDWRKGANLFPDKICSIDILRKPSTDMYDVKDYHSGGKKYLKQAFSNPVSIDYLK